METVDRPARRGCVIPKCGKAIKVRGLCSNCYGTARIAVKEGKCTWAELEEAGMSLPPKGKGERSHAPGKFIRLLEEFRKKRATANGSLPPSPSVNGVDHSA